RLDADAPLGKPYLQGPHPVFGFHSRNRARESARRSASLGRTGFGGKDGFRSRHRTRGERDVFYYTAGSSKSLTRGGSFGSSLWFLRFSGDTGPRGRGGGRFRRSLCWLRGPGS